MLETVREWLFEKGQSECASDLRKLREFRPIPFVDREKILDLSRRENSQLTDRVS